MKVSTARQAQPGVLRLEDQGFGNPADHHRTPDGSDRPVRRALRRAWRRRLQRDHGLDRQIAPSYFNNRKVSIYGGSNEIQRNIITKAVLGL
jgi:alkylation response protein AidB-like acyl-CoA dehydrogenase